MAASEAVTALLQELIRHRSVTPDDGGCQTLIAERLAALGFVVEHMDFGAVSNLWARLGDASPVLCFAGHTDVVPPGNPQNWRTNPFEPVSDGERLYGRGAADMKSGLAAMIVAAERFVANRPAFCGSLAFLITSDEEGEAVDGTRRVMEKLSARDENIDWCVIGEPSSARRAGDTVRIGRRGSLSGELVVRGRQGHVAYPEQIDNPVRRFAPALDELYGLDWLGKDDRFPVTSFDIVYLDAGTGALNVTPSELTVGFNFRFSPDWTAKRLQSKVTQLLDRHGLSYEIAWQRQGDPFITDPGPLIDSVVDAVRAVRGSAPELSTGGGTSDGRFIAPYGVQVVELGPANDSIHQANENVLLSDLPNLADMYQGIIERLLPTG